MDIDFISKGVQVANAAIESDNAGQYMKAIELYSSAIQRFQAALKYTWMEQQQVALKHYIREYEQRVNELKTTQTEIPEYVKQMSSMKIDSVPSKIKCENKILSTSSKREINEKINTPQTSNNHDDFASMQHVLVTNHTKAGWTDVAGLDEAKRMLQEAVILPIKYPSLFQGNRKPWKGILLYGLGGSGKSYLAQILAAEAKEATAFLSVSASDLISKYLGDSERSIKSLFEFARSKRPCIIFFDEIDALCSSRSDGEHEATRRIKTEILIQMQGVSKDNDNILVLAATNRPWDLDAAIRRRFQKRIYIPLPDAVAREKLLHLYIGDTPHQISSNDFNAMALLLMHYSGSDIDIVVKDALFSVIRVYQEATHFKLLQGENKWVPCSSSDEYAVSKTLKDIPDHLLHVLPLTTADIKCSMNKNKSSIDEKDLQRFEEWTKLYGENG